MRICECFRSIQGEGLQMGLPTVFVRAVGCNLRCRWCDTGYSYEGGREMTIDELLGMKDQLKFVIDTDEDLDFAVDFVKSRKPETNVIFGPVGGTERLEKLVDRVLAEGIDVRVLPQLHKIIWGNRRAV